MVTQGELKLDRLVWTYWAANAPAGLITGYKDEQDGVMIEHIVIFPGQSAGILVRMLRAALLEAWEREYAYVALAIPHNRPPGLLALAERMGFEPYETDDRAVWFVRYRP